MSHTAYMEFEHVIRVNPGTGKPKLITTLPTLMAHATAHYSTSAFKHAKLIYKRKCIGTKYVVVTNTILEYDFTLKFCLSNDSLEKR